MYCLTLKKLIKKFKMVKVKIIITLFLISIIIQKINAQPINSGKGFDMGIFQKSLIEEMSLQFPGLELDTTLNYVLRAENEYKKNSDGSYVFTSDRKLIIIKDAQDVADNPTCWTLINKGNVNILNNELAEAKRIVSKYKNEVLVKRDWPVTEKGLKRLGFVEFDALAINKNGTILYALVIDNNFDRNSLIIDTEKFEKSLKEAGFEVKEEKK
jgi:hypothetical protein